MDFRFGEDERDVIREAGRTFRRYLPPMRLIAANGVANGDWTTVARSGWLHAGIPEEEHGLGLPLVLVAAIAREAGAVLAGDAFVNNAWILPNTLGKLWWNETQDRQPDLGFLLLDGRENTLVDHENAFESTPWCFGVETGFAPYRLEWSLDQVKVERWSAKSWTVAPLSGLSPGCGEVTITETDPVAVEYVPCPPPSVLRGAVVLHSAALVGAGQRALEDTVAYARERHQFGGPIGRFQAIKHALADVAVGLEIAENAVFYAALSLTSTTVAAAALQSRRAAVAAAQAMVQFLGGIGFTWEHHAHLYLKTCGVSTRRFGSAEDYARALGQSLVDEKVTA